MTPKYTIKVGTTVTISKSLMSFSCMHIIATGWGGGGGAKNVTGNANHLNTTGGMIF
jgi:hypothetical protein